MKAIFSTILGMSMLSSAAYVHALNSIDTQFPHEFGKTHFIIGFPHDQLKSESTPSAKKQHKKEQAHRVSSQERAILFSPDDDLAQELIRLIHKDWRRIRVAIFTFTHDGIAQALLDAHKRGVILEIVTDPSYKSDRYSKIHLMQQEGVPVFEYDPEYIEDRRSNIMHHKFVIFEAADKELSLVWIGSFNFTRAADDRNQESIVKLEGLPAYESFTTQFERMREQRCVNCKKKSQRIAKIPAKRTGNRNKKCGDSWCIA